MTIKHSKSNNNRDDRASAAGQMITPKGKMFTYEELKSATGNFSPDTVVVEGGFGRVFKGWVDRETYALSKPGVGLAVAVMKYNPESCQRLQGEAFSAKNPNLGKLLGYCWEEKQSLVLVYEYKEEGSLETQPTFSDRMEILLRGKNAVQDSDEFNRSPPRFLSCTQRSESSIQTDLKPSNILLDRDDGNWIPGPHFVSHFQVL